MAREYLKGTWQENRAFSPAVVTRGGKAVWLAGVGARADEDGKSLAGNFEAQAHATFRAIGKTLERAGGKLQDIVTMTVFILDVRHGDRFVELRKQYFPGGFPASALITVAGFAHPDMMIEIQAVAVVGEE
ncbi:MAG: RidA family protein [Candidatus Tectomicrobia bacterium]|uniref:RidA family protein n=1 Tax=Tectimicrobiota bacterium TaxID=2528274 RepID=A0A932I3P9_UNCTE|nr:RidA family protein [Candidatus Tectomicrobia bacterium]